MSDNTVKSLPKEKCYLDSICARCDFFDGSDDGLECAGYRILLELVDKSVITLEDINDAKIKAPGRKK